MKRLSIISCLILFSLSLYASETDSLFQSDKIIKMELRADFTAIQNDRGENPVYHEAELEYKGVDRKKIKLPVKLMVRGNFRRDPDNCDFPPLSINFKKGELKNTVFENQDKLKIVTPCKSDDYVIQEYLVYKMYNLVTDKSLKVRLVRITYFDTSTDKVLFTRFSFFIEDKDRNAERNNSFVTETFLTPFDLNRDSYNKLAIFQYIIGNRDWYVTSRKNIILLQPNDTTLAPYAVPYDFDFSALVNADYTKPKNQVSLFPESRRIYKGICFTDTEYEEAFRFYSDLRKKYISLFTKRYHISPDATKQIVDFMDQFFTAINTKTKIQISEFNAVCETREIYNLPDI